MPEPATRNEAVHDNFTIERNYTSSPQKVFRAFADPEVKRRWFAAGPDFIAQRWDQAHLPRGPS